MKPMTSSKEVQIYSSTLKPDKAMIHKTIHFKSEIHAEYVLSGYDHVK